ncbi:M56 family metallopeptidase [Pedobacter caeni]|uniref:BlaR1 peptidase M56 n=1 Tax=Pedobacter caeni TaxID=288992 RepID=A0A1M5DGN0_9SPHI|nr:M56 family metallopeptidase [Pedobacter caeni]SHF66041.1 BlaR1 peptidase M56 [Pedobacter caeni]
MDWLFYMVKVSVCLTAFYGCYHFFLRRLTFFKGNRYFLLLGLLLSFVVPLIQIEVERVVSAKESVAVPLGIPLVAKGGFSEVKPAVVSALPLSEKPDLFSGDHWKLLLWYLYCIVALLMLLTFLVRMAVLLKAMLSSGQRFGRLKLVYKSEGFTNCSFFNCVFVNDNGLSGEEVEALLRHEELHSRKYHSLDKLLISVCKILLWFNPVIYLYERAIELVHEYEADEEASSGSFGTTLYAGLLLKLALKKRTPALTHGFALIPVKERIKMIFTKPSNRMKKLMYLAGLPLLAVLLWSFSIKRIDKVVDQKENVLAFKKKEQASDSTVRYQQKIKMSKAMLKGRKEFTDWQKTAEFKLRRSRADKLLERSVSGVLKGVYSDGNGLRGQRYLFEFDKETYVLDIGYGGEPTKGLLHVNDVISFKVSGVGMNKKDPYLSLTAFDIERDGKVIYQTKRAGEEVYPFLYEANRVRFTDGHITKIVEKGGGKVVLTVVANGYTFMVNFDETQVGLAALAKFTNGDAVRLRFVHEVKSGAKSYLINDWVAISKNIREYGVKNEKLFRKFYEPVSQTHGKITYSAQDSTKVDKKGGLVYLYGNAKLSYENMNIEADKIFINAKESTGIASHAMIRSSVGASPKRGNWSFDLKTGQFEVADAKAMF